MVRFETHLAAEKGLAALTVRNYKTDLQPLFDFMRLRDVGGLDALDRYALRAYLAWLVELGYVRASVVGSSARCARSCAGSFAKKSSTRTRCPGAES